MPYFTKESLETLKQHVDVVEVISHYVDLKRSGTSHKGLCPFHDEKTPSFHVTKSQGFYHCFGCGVHGDAIAFLMQHAKLTFSDAVESLAQRYQIPLEVIEGSFHDKEKIDRNALKLALEKACQLYHLMLIHTPEGHEACQYLFGRGIDLEFIQHFSIGYSLPDSSSLRKTMRRLGITEKTMIDAGILVESSRNGLRDPYADRIVFPIHDATGSVIGFSARKFKEETYGGKYVNTAETPLFKKNKILFGLHASRRRIAKDRQAIVVEGQLDALRLLYHGIDIVVAGQGTAFGEGHLKELTALGVREVFLAFDSDKAGRAAAYKTGHLLSKAGISVKIVSMPDGADPDSLVRAEGIDAFLKLLKNSQEYLFFLAEHLSNEFDVSSPAGKNGLIQECIKQIRQWEEPVLVHESLRRLAQIMQVPEETVGSLGMAPVHVYVKKNAFAGTLDVDPDKILECEILRWLITAGTLKPHFSELARKNLTPACFVVPACRRAYEGYLEISSQNKPCQLLSLACFLEEEEHQSLINDLLGRKINLERADELFQASLFKLLEREWMRKREEVRLKIQSGSCSDEEAHVLLQEFDRLKKTPPRLVQEDNFI